MLNIPHWLYKRLTDGSEVLSITRRPHSTPQKHFFFLVLISVGGRIKPPGPSAFGRMKIQFLCKRFKQSASLLVEFEVFWRRCITFRTTELWNLSFARNSKYNKTQCFGNSICFRSQVRGGRHLLCWVQWLRLALSKGPDRGVFLPSPEDENRCSFRNVVFSTI
jgi:hypothetical protein